mgnify:CR=1 FL=1
MKFLALFATVSAINMRAAPGSEARPSAAAGPVDSSKAGKKQHEQALKDQKVVGFHIADSNAVWDRASKSKNGPISTQPIPTPAGPSIPLHNKNKAGNGDRVTALAQGPAGVGPSGVAGYNNCKCMGTTCVDHEGATCKGGARASGF